jgi:hypothetical protein
MHTTQLLVLLGGAKLGVELVLRESGVILRIRRQIAFLGEGVSFRTDSARSYTLDLLKKIGIDWNLTGQFGSVVHLPSDDLRQVLGGDRHRGDDMSRSSRTETISTTNLHLPNVNTTRGNLVAM